MGKINFFSLNTRFSVHNKRKIRNWLLEVIRMEEIPGVDSINIIICSDKYLLDINRKFLNHDFLTDIITFTYSPEDKSLEGELYISIERVKENSKILNIPVEKEFRRVIVHGILHLCGYDDKRKKEKEFMHDLENRYLQLIEN
jgi:probable rRNA maturation factor